MLRELVSLVTELNKTTQWSQPQMQQHNNTSNIVTALKYTKRKRVSTNKDFRFN